MKYLFMSKHICTAKPITRGKNVSTSFYMVFFRVSPSSTLNQSTKVMSRYTWSYTTHHTCAENVQLRLTCPLSIYNVLFKQIRFNWSMHANCQDVFTNGDGWWSDRCVRYCRNGTRWYQIWRSTTRPRDPTLRPFHGSRARSTSSVTRWCGHR